MCYNGKKGLGRRFMAVEHEGHRQRIREKLEAGTLLDHELLEILLFPSLPRRNTNDIAHRLLQTFGSSAMTRRVSSLMSLGCDVVNLIRVCGAWRATRRNSSGNVMVVPFSSVKE